MRLAFKLFVASFIVLSLVGCQYCIEVTKEEREKAVYFAKTQIGKPYVYGVQDPDIGFDCSGLIVWAYRQAVPDIQFKVGCSLYDDANASDLYWNIRDLSISEADTGDIILLAKDTEIEHVVLIVNKIDDTKVEIIHASSYYGKVIQEEWNILEDLRGYHIAKIGRLLKWE